MTKNILKTLLATAALLPLASAAIADGHDRTDLVIADLGQPETNPWVINRHRFERCVADALGVELKEFDDQNSEEQHVARAESIMSSPRFVRCEVPGMAHKRSLNCESEKWNPRRLKSKHWRERSLGKPPVFLPLMPIAG